MELRLYSFVNFYLSSIQQGIQTGHAAVDLVRKYADGGDNDEALYAKHKMVNDWADNHKTFIILNGGDLEGVINAQIVVQKAGFPNASFYESQPALGGMLTCVASVLPESIFNARVRQPISAYSQMYSEPVYEYVQPLTNNVTSYYPNHQHYELIKLLRGSRLAS